jgi:Domain of unknown function (DUF5666)/Domain of unknown function (DUF5667)
MNRDLENALVEALDLLEQGTPVVRILAQYPDMAEDLRPFLVTAVDLNRVPKSAPAAAQETSKRDFLQYAAAMENERRRPAATWLWQFLRGSLALLMFLFLGTAALVFMSDDALPGDALYGAKLFVEGQQLNYSANPAASAVLIDEFRRERVDEVAELLARGRQERVYFDGEVEKLAPGRWIVEGIPVTVNSSTSIPDGVEVGFLVRITGETVNGAVVAQYVDLLDGRAPEPDLIIPVPTLEPSPTPAPTAVPVNTPQKPDILQPDDSSQAPTPLPLPSPTITREDDPQGGDGGEVGDDDKPPEAEDSENTNDRQEQDEAGGGSLAVDPTADQGEDNGDNSENSSGGGGESSGDESDDGGDHGENSSEESSGDHGDGGESDPGSD